MDTSLKNILGLLGSLKRPLRISDVTERKLLQKIVYLGQALGLPTNYEFSWYIHGPYSPALTQDYFELDAKLKGADTGLPRLFLSDTYASVADNIIGLLSAKPEQIPEADWAELLASTVFLRKESELSEADSRAVIEKKKRHVAPHYGAASTVLSKYHLI